MKIFKYIVVGMCTFMATSCGDNWLDLESPSSVETEGSINELSDVKATLYGVYDTMQDAYAYSGRLVYYGDATGDDMQARSATMRTGNAYLLSFTKDNSPSSYWSYPYAMITSCNMVINGIDKIQTSESELKDYYKGEALALRALNLFTLTRIYGYPYKKDNGASLGVPIIEEMLDKNAKPARNTVAECYDAIIRDLNEAANLMNNDEGNSFQKGRINRWGVLTLLSRVYLYHGDDAKALETAEAAIAGAEKEGYELWTNEEYLTAWSNDVSASHPGEVLFEVVNTTDDDPGKESLGYLHNSNGYRDIILTSSFYEMLKSDPKDVRANKKFFTFYSKRALVYKYQPQEGEEITSANIPLLRLSETYLNAAEAAQKCGDLTKAAHYLNAIVKRANPDNSVDEADVTLERIMTERRKELVGEGHRMFDALRDGGYVDRHESSKKISEISSTKHLTMSADRKRFNWDSFLCVLPIPKAEMDANPNIKQNPGYDGSAK